MTEHLDNVRLREERDRAVEWIGVVRDDLIVAGGAAGDRDVALANLRSLIDRVNDLPYDPLYEHVAALNAENTSLTEQVSRLRDALRELLALVDSDRYGTDYPLADVEAIIGNARTALIPESDTPEGSR